MVIEKGVTRKLQFPSRVLDDEMVRDGLEAVSLLNDKVPYYLVGGIATQSYLPSRCRRPTSDIDFSVVMSLNYEDFKRMVLPLAEWFKDKGFQIETKKRSRAYSLDVTNQEDESLCMEFGRRNKNNFHDNRKRLERELDNSKSKIIEDRDATYRVATPEDIVVPKLVRSTGSLKRNPQFLRYISRDVEPLTDEKIYKSLKRINEMREEAMINMADPEVAEKLRLVSDLYDIRVLSEVAGLNEKYLGQVQSDWSIFGDNPSELQRLKEFLLPKFYSFNS